MGSPRPERAASKTKTKQQQTLYFINYKNKTKKTQMVWEGFWGFGGPGGAGNPGRRPGFPGRGARKSRPRRGRKSRPRRGRKSRPEGPEIRAPGGAGPRGPPLFFPFHLFPRFFYLFFPLFPPVFSLFKVSNPRRSRILFRGSQLLRLKSRRFRSPSTSISKPPSSLRARKGQEPGSLEEGSDFDVGLKP